MTDVDRKTKNIVVRCLRPYKGYGLPRERERERRDADNVTHRVMNLAIPGTRRRGRPKKTWNQQLKDDMTAVGVTQDVALDRTGWRRRTRPAPRR